jgi:hypothetical protein
MFLFKECSAKVVLSLLYAGFIRIQGQFCLYVGKQNTIFMLFSGYILLIDGTARMWGA